ncbi:hypothetical protein LTR94_019034 [Friedmanniomyces endolithicus]|nr:hypothetical protein LTR94_019034 [Friedmanniomyces endolithicus]
MGGDPSREEALAILKGLPAAGADIIELGFPFSDPMAEGPPIQRAAIRGLKAGFGLRSTMDLAREFRKGDDVTPIVLMGYLNPIESLGYDAFAAYAAECGIDGLIVVDCPPEEAGPLIEALDKVSISLIRLATPTSDDERLKIVVQGTSGFVYYVAVAGVTGVKEAKADVVAPAVERVRKASGLPVAVGFGVKTPERAAEIARVADAVVVGSALVDEVAAAPRRACWPGRRVLPRRKPSKSPPMVDKNKPQEKRGGWLSRFAPGVRKIVSRRDTPDNLWVKDPDTGEMLYRSDLEAALWVTPSGRHMRIDAPTRLKATFDGAVYDTIETPDVPEDPLKFSDGKSYKDRLNAARKAAGRKDTMAIGWGSVGGQKAVVIVQDFTFMGGSLGMAAGEAFIKAAREAVARKVPLVCFTAAGGARMQEGALSLMQMARTTLAIEELKSAKLPYVVVLTDPTTGGVTASYAMLGDVHLAEPGALIGFAGPRVIEATIREKLPPGFQRAEYLQEKGMVDRVVTRADLPQVLGRILSVLMGGNRQAA